MQADTNELKFFERFRSGDMQIPESKEWVFIHAFKVKSTDHPLCQSAAYFLQTNQYVSPGDFFRSLNAAGNEALGDISDNFMQLAMLSTLLAAFEGDGLIHESRVLPQTQNLLALIQIHLFAAFGLGEAMYENFTVLEEVQMDNPRFYRPFPEV